MHFSIRPSWRKFLHPLRSLYALLAASGQACIDHRVGSLGAALSFYTLFSMAPILTMAIAVASYFFGQEAAQGEIVAQIQDLVGTDGAQAIQSVLSATRNHADGLQATVVAAVLFVVAATTVFVELKASLDALWADHPRTPPKKPRSALNIILQTRLLAFGLVLALAFLLLISLVVSAGLAMVEHRAAGIWGGSVEVVVLASLSSLISAVAIGCLFAVIYKMLPDAPLSWRDVWIGAAFTSGLFSIGKFAIGLYIGHSTLTSGFGAAGSLVALLLWIYYSAQIFFFGAEFTRQYALQFGSLRQAAAHSALSHRQGASRSLSSSHSPTDKRNTMSNDAQSRTQLWSLIKDIKFAMFTTRHGNGHLHSQPMTTQNKEVDEDDRLWFFMSWRSGSVDDFVASPEVNVSYSNPDDHSYVSVSGTAHVANDLAKKRALWNSMAAAWFPGGVDDPDLVLVEVRITHAQVWDVKENKITQLYQLAKAAVTGKAPPHLGETSEIRMG